MSIQSGRNSHKEDRLKSWVRQRLIESGWKDQVKEKCSAIVASRRGGPISAELLAAGVTSFARESVPPSLKSQLLERVERASGQVNDRP
jgi:Transcription factor e(y)2